MPRNRCIGRLVSDTKDKGKIAFYHDDPLMPKAYYHIAIQCINTSTDKSKLCASCLEKLEKTKSATIKNSRILANHPSVLHGTIDDPIPIWSHIEGGDWFKKMLEKNYRVEEEELEESEDTMVKKQFPNEKEVFDFIDSLKDKSKKMVLEELQKKYKVFTKTSANRYHIAYNKEKKKPVKEKVEKVEKVEKKKTTKPVIQVKEQINTIEIDDSKVYRINETKKDDYEVEVVELCLLTIKKTEYYYDKNTNDLYDLEYSKVGKYNCKTNSIVHHEDQ